MSCTVVSLPVLLLTAAVSGIISGVNTTIDAKKEDLQHRENIKNIILKNMEQGGANKFSIETADIICKQYETVFMDEDVLLKTLDEYGVEKIELKDGRIVAYVDKFVASFYKPDTEKPYIMDLQYAETCDSEEFVSDLHDEYAMNVQEETYLKLKERLSAKNMQIESEEVLEDDSIMITVNLE